MNSNGPFTLAIFAAISKSPEYDSAAIVFLESPLTAKIAAEIASVKGPLEFTRQLVFCQNVGEDLI